MTDTPLVRPASGPAIGLGRTVFGVACHARRLPGPPPVMVCPAVDHGCARGRAISGRRARRDVRTGQRRSPAAGGSVPVLPAVTHGHPHGHLVHQVDQIHARHHGPAPLGLLRAARLAPPDRRRELRETAVQLVGGRQREPLLVVLLLQHEHRLVRGRRREGPRHRQTRRVTPQRVRRRVRVLETERHVREDTGRRHQQRLTRQVQPVRPGTQHRPGHLEPLAQQQLGGAQRIHPHVQQRPAPMSGT